MNFDSTKKHFFHSRPLANRPLFRPGFSFLLLSLLVLGLTSFSTSSLGQEVDRVDEIQSAIEQLQRELDMLRNNQPTPAATVPSLFDARGLEVEAGQLSSGLPPGAVIVDSQPVLEGAIGEQPLLLSAPLPADAIAPGFAPVPGTGQSPSFDNPSIELQPQTAELNSALPSLPLLSPPVRRLYQPSQRYYRPPYSSRGSSYYESSASRIDGRDISRWYSSRDDGYRRIYDSHSDYARPSCRYYPVR
jgi:hypothetical protein